MRCKAYIYEKLYGDIIAELTFINEHYAKKWIAAIIKEDDIDLDASILPLG